MLCKTLHNRIHSGRGVARLVFIVIIAAALMAVLILGVPLYHYFVDRSDAYGCGSALATANDQLKIWYLTAGGDSTPAEAKAEVTRAMNGWSDLCPGGGDCYLLETGDEDETYRVVCALHDSDVEEAAMLNAKSALKQLQTAQDEDEAVSGVTLNSRGYSVTFDPTETTIIPTRKALRDAGGTLLSCHIEDGIVTWFCYANDSCVLTWRLDEVGSITDADGWTVRYT